MHEAYLYERSEDGKVRCFLCNHRCVISEGKRGICGVRENREGTLYSLVYGLPVAQHVDPIEKKPLFHFFPGSRAYSVATVGCNFRCLHCQNYDISQMPRDYGRIAGEEASPEDIVRAALRTGCKSISYTYTEPTVFFELAFETARLAHSRGLYNNFITNGYMTQEALYDIAPFLDAANVDLKAFTEEHYRKVCGARLQPVLDSLKLMKRLGIWVEVTTLIIPGLNDDEPQLRDIARFIKDELGPETPWHVTAFFPTYRMTDRPRTPPSSLRRAREIGLEEGLKYVYTGNIPGEEGEHTYCPSCGRVLIRRYGFYIVERSLKDGRCTGCGTRLDGVGLDWGGS
ncbi:MAG: AmmeMemoRadiSam system radical SAM enzyme [Candidatus Latescibacterota bacterium]|nr:MAG: AmmeMemoRadiSam system radical SAM enzyme [Candidatus Latescibacterota bacterium]